MSNKSKATFIKPELSVEELTKALYNVNVQLSESNQRLIESERQRQELFANLSHDLRSPLTTIKSYIEYLLSFDDIDEKELNDTLNLMNTKVQSIEHMINEIFTINTIDAQTDNVLNFQKVNAKEYLDTLFKSYKSDSRTVGRQYLYSISDEVKCDFLIDIQLISRAIDNLISNAFKYSAKGDSVQVKACLNDNYINIEVTDTGIGISEENLPKVFERSFRVASARTPDPSIGCGLGLSIVQSIITRHGGRVWCQSELGRGSTFTISIPCYNDMR